MTKQIKFCLCILVILYSVILGYAIFTGQVSFRNNSTLIFLASIVLFAGLTIFSLKNQTNLFLVLPFMFLGFPTIINNIFPGIIMGVNYELGSTTFPLFTHIDLFLIINLIRYRRINTITRLPKYLFWAVLLFLVSSIVNVFDSRIDQEIALIGCGLYLVRYFILIYWLLSKLDVKNHFYQIVYGLAYSICFLFLESITNTYLNDFPSLISGTLGSNSFGNITGQILVFFTVVLIFHKDSLGVRAKLLLKTCMVLCIAIVILTKTRMALLGLALNSLIVYSTILPIKKLVQYLAFLVILLGISFQFVDQERYGLSNLTSNISYGGSASSGVLQNIDIENSEATNSLITRLELINTSIEMIQDSPFFGIGVLKFNLLKYKFGFGIDVLIDPHNGYLFFLTQLGLVGCLWIFFIYIRPIYLFYKIKDPRIKYLSVINIGMFICDFTNAGVFKMSIVSLLIFISLILEIQYINEKSDSNSDSADLLIELDDKV